jgi:hypothetical protein
MTPPKNGAFVFLFAGCYIRTSNQNDAIQKEEPLVCCWLPYSIQQQHHPFLSHRIAYSAV